MDPRRRVGKLGGLSGPKDFNRKAGTDCDNLNSPLVTDILDRLFAASSSSSWTSASSPPKVLDGDANGHCSSVGVVTACEMA